MKISTNPPPNLRALIVPVRSDLKVGPGLDPQFDTQKLSTYLESLDFSTEDGVTTLVDFGEPSTTLALVGVGDGSDPETIRRATARGMRAIPAATEIGTSLHQLLADPTPVIEGSGLADYQPPRTGHKASQPTERTLYLLPPITAEEDDHLITAGSIGVEATKWARDLINIPALKMGPDQFISAVHQAVDDTNITAEVWKKGRLKKERMGGILGVGAGSDRSPRLLSLFYRPDNPAARVVLVGKGIVFDSGGLSLKPADYMEKMKTDMTGAAVVAAVVKAVAQLELNVELAGYMPLAENLVGGSAIRPGDVLTCRNGKTIEVLNTDAEGRLVMADCLALGAESQPDLMIDVATLTGACRIALGDLIGGVFSNRDMLASQVLDSGQKVGESWWELPLASEYRRQLKTDLADMRNIGERYGGAITAALVLEEFTDDLPWIHLDIAGPARSDKDNHYIRKGATGFGVRTLIDMMTRLSSVSVGSWLGQEA